MLELPVEHDSRKVLIEDFDLAVIEIGRMQEIAGTIAADRQARINGMRGAIVSLGSNLAYRHDR